MSFISNFIKRSRLFLLAFTFLALSANAAEINALQAYNEALQGAKFSEALSKNNLKVYFSKDSDPTGYRIKALEDVIKNIVLNAKNQNFTLVINLLPNNRMSMRLFNDFLATNISKENPSVVVIQSEATDDQDLENYLSGKEAVNEVTLQYNFRQNDSIEPVFFFFQKGEFENIKNPNILRDFFSQIQSGDVIGHVSIEGHTNVREGQAFFRHLLGLKRACVNAGIFMHFSQVIDIVSPTENNSGQAYQKVLINF